MSCIIEARFAREYYRGIQAVFRSNAKAGAGEGNRTLVFSLEGCCSTIELHPRNSKD
jgi:hypothetical protein